MFGNLDYSLLVLLSLVLWIWFDTHRDSGCDGCFSGWGSVLIWTFLKGGLHRVFFISPLSDHFTHGQLGEDDSVWEAAFCHSDTVVVLDELLLHEQGLSAGAVCLKICWHLSCSSPLKCQGFSSLVEPFEWLHVWLQHIWVGYPLYSKSSSCHGRSSYKMWRICLTFTCQTADMLLVVSQSSLETALKITVGTQLRCVAVLSFHLFLLLQ